MDVYEWMMNHEGRFVEVVGMTGMVHAGADENTPNEFVFDDMIVDDNNPTLVD